jgi:hypothetical protein
LTPEQDKILGAPIDPEYVEIRPDGIVYLPWVHWARTYNAAFGRGAWALVPLSKPIIQDHVLCLHYAMYVQGKFVGEAVGEQVYRMGGHSLSWASATEACASDAITRLGKRLGLNWELWDPRWRLDWIAEYAVQVWIADQGKFQMRRKDRPALPGEAKPGRGSESEYHRGASLDRENQAHLDSIQGEGFDDDSRE